MFPLKDNIPTDRFPVVTAVLLAANVLVYLLLQRGGLSLPESANAGVVEWGAIPYEFTNAGEECAISGENVTCGDRDAPGPPTYVTAFSSMFMHGSLLHLGGNMLFLWIFGNNVEDSMGRVRFVVFYLLGGLAALGLQIAIDLDAAVPTVGASGAIAGVLGGYILLFPRARVLTVIFIVIFFTIVEIPAFLVLGLWFVQQVLFGYFDLANPTGGGGVAYFAHIGGFVFGALAIRAFAQRLKRPPAARFPVP